MRPCEYRPAPVHQSWRNSLPVHRSRTTKLKPRVAREPPGRGLSSPRRDSREFGFRVARWHAVYEVPESDSLVAPPTGGSNQWSWFGPRWLRDVADAVSYTHLTLPTKRIV